VHQAAGDLYVHHGGGRGPGRGSVAVPYDGTEHVVRGRDDLLDELAALTAMGGRSVLLHGAGGFGKTAIALSLARRVSGSVHVWWVDATDSHSLTEDLREVALRAGAAAKPVRRAWRGDRSAPDLLWSALERLREPWLLVLDNADALGAGDGRDWLRTPPRSGTVLITSRDGRASTWGGRVVSRRVPALEPPDAAAVLRELAPRAGDLRQATDLAEALGGLPLALCLAGRYLDATAATVRLPGADQPRTFDEYRTMLRDRFADAVTAVTPDPAGRRDHLVTTWESSLDLLHDRGHPLARPLLRLLSTFAPVPVPSALLDAAVLTGSPVFAGATPTRLAALVSELAGLGLVEVHHDDLDTVSLHPLVRDVTRHHVDDHDPYTGTRLALLHRLATRAADPSNWALWRALLPHCEHERQAVRADAAFADLCHGAGGAAYEHGFHTAAERLYRRALRVRLDLLGPRHPDTLATRHNLAVLLADDGDPEAAREELREVLADQVAVLGEHHPDVLTTRRDLAWTAWSCGEHAAAEAEYRVIAAVQREVLGETHPDTLITRYEIAAALHDRGDVRAASTALRDLLHDQVRVLGRLHPHTLITGHRLARVCHDGLDPHHVVRLTIAALGPDHPITLTARTGRAVVLRGAEAEAELRDIQEVLASRRGPDHPETLASQHNLRVATTGTAEDDGLRATSLGRRRGHIRVVDPVALPEQRRGSPWS
jgi:hypothetical protein